MTGFVQEHARPLLGAAALHVALLAVLAGAALRWTSSQEPVQLAIEGVVVDSRDLPRSVLQGKPIKEPVPEVAPKPVPQPPPPKPVEKAAPPPEPVERADAQVERERAAALERADAQREAERSKAEEAAQAAKAKAKAEADAKKRADEDALKRQLAEEETRKRKEQDAKTAAASAERESELRRQLAAEEEVAAFARSGVVDEYRALLVQTIERNWIRPPTARAGLECTLFVTQAPGGTVIDVRLGPCNGDDVVRESVVNAVHRASPLPPPRDPRAFQKRLEIVFRPTE